MFEFEMPFENTCARCGETIKTGSPVFAENHNRVVAGGGICAACYHGALEETISFKVIAPAGKDLYVDVPAPSLDQVAELAAMTVNDIRAMARDADHPGFLRQALAHERAGKNRKSALEALEARILELEAGE